MATGNLETPAARTTTRPRTKRGVPEGLWQQCPGCQATIYRKEAEQRQNTCPECDYHWYVSARDRVHQVLDDGTFEEWDAELMPADPLGFADKKPYADRLVAEQKRTGLRDAALTGGGMIRARRVAFGVTDSAFIMGSMGSVVGERLTRLVERATEQKLPLIIISGSGGGARMHEGILSLMQMAKVSAALARYRRGRRPVHLGAHQSDDGRRGGQLCLAGRPGLCRAQGPDRLCRPANDQGHDPHRAAQGLSDQRVPAGARLHRSHRPPSGAEERNRPGDRLLRQVVRR